MLQYSSHATGNIDLLEQRRMAKKDTRDEGYSLRKEIEAVKLTFGKAWVKRGSNRRF